MGSGKAADEAIFSNYHVLKQKHKFPYFSIIYDSSI